MTDVMPEQQHAEDAHGAAHIGATEAEVAEAPGVAMLMNRPRPRALATLRSSPRPSRQHADTRAWVRETCASSHG